MLVAVVNTKGGVGKTTTAVHLAAVLNAHAPTLLLDCDPHGSATAWLDQADSELDYAPFAQLGLAKAISNGIAEDYRFVVVDTPPNDVAMTQDAITAADLVVVPTAPSLLDIDRLAATQVIIENLRTIKDVPARVVLTAVDGRTVDEREARAGLNRVGYELTDTTIAMSADVRRGFGEDVNPATSPYRPLATELLAVLEREAS